MTRRDHFFNHLLLGLVLILLGACVPSVYDRPYPITEVTLPRDDAAHPAPIEWWYYTGHLEDEEGNGYGFELTFFKAYTPPRLTLLGFLPLHLVAERGHIAHFGLTDKTRQRFVMAERADFWGYGARASTQDLEVYVGGWRAERAANGTAHAVRAATEGYAVELELEPLKPAALHGDPPGIQSMGPGGVSYYLSYTRMAAKGVIKRNCTLLGCETLKVTGQAWHDHQWGDFDLFSYAGWDWFSLQFEDDSELMLYLIRQPDGSYSERAGSFITQDGRTLPLSAADFELQETGETWTSPATGAVYPLGWRVRVPRHGIDARVEPVMPDQEMDTRASTGVVYWEGAVTVEGAKPGVGYVELTNYDLYPYGQTAGTTELKPPRGPFAP